jgi:hypothetical protein
MDGHLTTESCVSQQLIVGGLISTLQPMVVLSKQAVRNDFAKRLNEAVMDHPHAPKDRGKAAWLARQLQVSGEMARKWLAGEALPNQARMAGLANSLGVKTAWLRDGDLPKHSDSNALDARTANRISERSVTAYGVTVSEAGMLFAAEWEKLGAEARYAIEQLVMVMVGKNVRELRGRMISGEQAGKPNG